MNPLGFVTVLPTPPGLACPCPEHEGCVRDDEERELACVVCGAELEPTP